MSIELDPKIGLPELKTLSRAITSYEDIPLLVKHFAETICHILSVKGCSMMLYDEREKQLFRVGSFGISTAYLNKGPLFIDGKYSAFVTGKPVFIEDFQADDRVQYPQAAATEGIVSMLSVPIRCQRAPIGLIRLYHSQRLLLHEEDIDSFTLLADNLGFVIENNGLRHFLDKVKSAMETLPLRMLEGIAG
jgi:GAF domain-containing protein